MRQILGYREGRAVWSANDPGYVAVAQGHGAAAMGFFSGTVLAVKPPQPKRLPRQRQQRHRVLCGKPTAGTQCARTAGHSDSHRTQAWMDRRAAGMRRGL